MNSIFFNLVRILLTSCFIIIWSIFFYDMMATSGILYTFAYLVLLGAAVEAYSIWKGDVNEIN